MRVRNIYIIALFQIAVLCAWAQNGSDYAQNSKSEGITLVVDTEIPQGKTQEELEKEAQEQVNEKWHAYLSGKNEAIEKLYRVIQQIDSNHVTKEDVEEYILQVNKLKSDFEKKKETSDLWKNNDELDELRETFDFNCEKALVELGRLQKKLDKGDGPNKLLVLGICLLGLMAVVPIFSQIKSGIMARKAKLEQQLQLQQAKRLQEKAKDQMLLADENNIITLKE